MNAWTLRSRRTDSIIDSGFVHDATTSSLVPVPGAASAGRTECAGCVRQVARIWRSDMVISSGGARRPPGRPGRRHPRSERQQVAAGCQLRCDISESRDTRYSVRHSGHGRIPHCNGPQRGAAIRVDGVAQAAQLADPERRLLQRAVRERDRRGRRRRAVVRGRSSPATRSTAWSRGTARPRPAARWSISTATASTRPTRWSSRRATPRRSSTWGSASRAVTVK